MLFERLEMSLAGPFPEGEGEVRWVTVEWLNEHLDDDITIIDCQPNVHDFIRGHIPGAVYLAEESLRLSQQGYPHVWLPSAMAQEILQTVGVSEGKQVVVYTQTNPNLPTGDGVPQGMIAYTLARYGHSRILLLDGGLEAWIRDARKLGTKYSATKKGDFKALPRKDLTIKYSDFLRIKDDDDVVHIDSRSSAQYQGKSPWPKEGHIPGAINIPWSEMFSKDNLTKLRPKRGLVKLFAQHGITREKKVVCHCGSGRKAAAQLVVLKWFLGYPNVRLFEGSLTEWCAHEGNETSIGPSP